MRHRVLSVAISAALICGAIVTSSTNAVADPPQENEPRVMFSDVEVSDTLNCYVEIAGDSSPEFFGGTACGTFVSYGGVVYGPEYVPAGGAAQQVAFTPVSCPADPDPIPGLTAIQRCVSLGDTGLKLRQIDRYAPQGTAITTEIMFYDGPSTGQVIVYRAGDCYVANSDFGTGTINLASRTVSCVSDETTRVQQWQDQTTWTQATMEEAFYSSIWARIGAQEMFANVASEEVQDNGAGLSWAFNLATDKDRSLVSRMAFIPEAWSQDTDGDGLPDSWECEGCGFDGNNNGFSEDDPEDIPLYKMGARVDVPDLFLELDWMVQPALRFQLSDPLVDFVILPEVSYKPSAQALKWIQKSFWDHGYSYGSNGQVYSHINLHIDAGPDSVMDFPSGQTWGSLSEGTSVPFNDWEVVENGDWTRFDENYKKQYFDSDMSKRGRVFRYGLLSDRSIDGASGRAWGGIPRSANSSATAPAYEGAQFFVAATGVFGRGDWSSYYWRDMDHAVAGTIMHEFGHTLGLGHGGIDENIYKPNYPSVMNYYYQVSGLFGTNVDSINYSQWKLNDLDENALLERQGVGEALPANLGVEWTCLNGTTKRAIPGWAFGGAPIDFNCNGVIDGNHIRANLNSDGSMVNGNYESVLGDLLVGYNDWDHLIFQGGAIGALGIAAPEPPMVTPDLEELTMEEALAHDVLGNPGYGALAIVGPYTVIAGEAGQNLFVGVDNLSWTAGEWTISASGDLLPSDFSGDISVEGSTADSLTSGTLAIPLIANPQPGSYTIEVVLTGESGEQGRLEVPIEVVALDTDQRSQLLEAAQAGEIDVDPLVNSQIIDVLEAEVTFDGNGGTPISQTVQTVDSDTVVLPSAPTRDGYTFTGWNTQRDGTGVSFTADSVVDESLTVYAQWEQNEPVVPPTDNETQQPSVPELSASPTPEGPSVFEPIVSQNPSSVRAIQTGGRVVVRGQVTFVRQLSFLFTFLESGVHGSR